MIALIDQALVISWIAVSVFLFRRLQRPIAVIVIVMFGQMFLPEVQSIPITAEGMKAARLPLLEFSKLNVISYGLLLATILTDLPRLQRLRFRWFDFPAIALSLIPSISAVLNGSSMVDAFAHFRNATLTWGVPYFIGRVYLSDLLGCYRVVLAIAIGGLIYVPFCLWESRMGPTLHQNIFGFHQHSFMQTLRWGGYRPIVFMQHGLVVGFWMVVASLSVVSLWRAQLWPPTWFPQSLRRHGTLLAAAIVCTAIWCKSLGAVALGVLGGLVLWISPLTRSRLLMMLLIATPVAYTMGRATGLVTREFVTSVVGTGVIGDRKDSFDFRIECEDEFLRVVSKQPLLGMGADPKARPVDEDGRPVISDAMWIIQFFDTGYVGLISLLAFFLWPAWRFLRLCPPVTWRRPDVAPAATAAVILVLTMCDFCVNGLLNPVFIILAAALNGWNQSVTAARRS